MPSSQGEPGPGGHAGVALRAANLVRVGLVQARPAPQKASRPLARMRPRGSNPRRARRRTHHTGLLLTRVRPASDRLPPPWATARRRRPRPSALRCSSSCAPSQPHLAARSAAPPTRPSPRRSPLTLALALTLTLTLTLPKELSDAKRAYCQLSSNTGSAYCTPHTSKSLSGAIPHLSGR